MEHTIIAEAFFVRFSLDVNDADNSPVENHEHNVKNPDNVPAQ